MADLLLPFTRTTDLLNGIKMAEDQLTKGSDEMNKHLEGLYKIWQEMKALHTKHTVSLPVYEIAQAQKVIRILFLLLDNWKWLFYPFPSTNEAGASPK